MNRSTTNGGAPVCVIIAAYNAQATIGRAILSALSQAEVAEVMVIDDASPDGTADRARSLDDGTGRLTVMTLAANAGPSAARNVAIANSRAPLIAILDADDFFLPGRFADLLAVPGWDMIADNIAFVGEGHVDGMDIARIAAHHVPSRTLDAAAFVAGCLSRPGRYKGELGFLKPLLSRAFLDRYGLRYAEQMRLAEDYDLYVRALMAGARFRLAGTCGYVAVERAGSLSSDHGLPDLVSFETAVAALLAAAPAEDSALRNALSRHLAQTARKRRHRQLLARKHEVGLIRAIGDEARSPANVARMLTDVARDKLGGIRQALLPRTQREPPDRIRFLL
ncbi:glycosyltransferase family 2 protein [uncultured Sphingomonas sp.]|uniref:glycosyltransferase family 2 protein n=1 Tax=uncultured Sphingomonas sp. TaxID=158754 RepID=UPI0035CAE287